MTGRIPEGEPTAKDARALADLRRFRTTALRIAARGDAAFFDPDDDILRLAARSVVINVAAAVDRLSDDYRAQFSDVPWRAIRATRNYVAHAYDQVNDRVIWTAMRRDVPDLVDRLVGSGGR